MELQQGTAEEVIVLPKDEARPDDGCLWECRSNRLFSFGLCPPEIAGDIGLAPRADIWIRRIAP